MAGVKVRVDGDASGLEQGAKQGQSALRKLGEEGKKAAKESNAGFGGFGKSLSGLIGPLAGMAAGFASVSTAMGYFNGYIRDYGDQLGKFQSATGIGADALDKLKQNAELAGVSFGDVKNSIKFMLKAVGEATTGNAQFSDTFKEIGLDINKIKDLSPEEQFYKISEALQNVDNDGQRVAAGQQLLGRNYLMMTNLLTDVREKMEGTSTAWTPEAAKRVEAFNDNLTILKNNMQGTLLPVALELIGVMNNLFPKKDTVVSVAREHIQQYSKELNELKYKFKTLNDYKKQGFGVDEEAIAKLERRIKLTQKNLEQSRESLKVANEQEKIAKESKAKTGGDMKPIVISEESKAVELARLDEVKAYLAKFTTDKNELMVESNRMIEEAMQHNTNVTKSETAAIGEEYQARQAMTDEFFSMKEAYEEKANEYSRIQIQSWKEMQVSAVQDFAGGMSQAAIDFTSGTKSMGDAWSDFAKSFVNDTAKMVIQAMILKSIKSTSWGSTLFAADGAVIDSGHQVKAFAKGGVVDSPTIFPMASGAGVMGEAGPEAIMPLTRKNGKLGVEATGGSGGGQTTVVYNINAIDSQSLADHIRRNQSAYLQPLNDGVNRGDQGILNMLKAGAS
jgi:hypothetical protein